MKAPSLLALALALTSFLAPLARAGTPQTISFAELPGRNSTDAPFALTATASSGLTVAYSIVSTGAVASVAGGTVTLAGPTGSVTVEANQAGDGTFDPAPPVRRTFLVHNPNVFSVLARGSQGTHMAGIRTDGTLWTWGANSNGQLGLGDFVTRFVPTQLGTATNWQSVALGSGFTLAVRTDGTLWAFGANASGQLGLADTTLRSAPVQVGSATDWAFVAAGGAFSVAVKSDGTLWTWGINTNGQLGLADTTLRNVPTQVGTDTNWASAAAGTSFVTALRTDGTRWSWGLNTNGQLGLGDTTQRTSPVQLGLLTTWQSVAAGSSFALARRTDGTLWACGLNLAGQLGDNSVTQRNSPVQVGTATNWSAVTCSATSTGALRTDGTLWTWGSGALAQGEINNRLVPTQVGTATLWQSLSFFFGTGSGLTTDGTLWTWGAGDAGQLAASSGLIAQPTPWGTTKVVSPATGGSHSLVVLADGTLWAWGVNGSGQLGDNTTISRATPTRIGLLSDWQSVGAGTSHSLAVKTDGRLWAWGFNSNNQLGDTTTNQRNAPVVIGAATNWSAVSAGSNYSLGLRNDGTLWGWGTNSNGQLGLGDTTQRNAPTQVGSATTWQSMSAGNVHAAAVRTDGTIWVWGSNSNGQLGLGDNTQRTSPVQVGTANNWQSAAAGNSYTLALRTDGTLWAWGANAFNTPTQFGSATDWVAVTAGSNHALLVKRDGSLWAMRANQLGQLALGLPDATTRLVPEQIGTAANWDLVRTGAASDHSLAVRGTSVWGFGSSVGGQVVGGEMGRNVPRPGDPGRAPQNVQLAAFTAEFGLPVVLAGTSSSGRPVSYAVSATPSSAASVSGNVLTVHSAGSVILTAWEAGDDNAWQPASPISVIVSPDLAVEQPAATALLDAVSSVDFAGVTEDVPSEARVFTVRNNGRMTLNFSGVNFTGPHASDFAIVSAGPASLAPGASSTFSVAFTPAELGPRSAVMHLLNDTPGARSSFEVNLSGTGIPPFITFPPPPTRLATDAPFALSATASTGLPVSYQIVSSGGIATLAGSTVTLTGLAGAVTILATQPGNGTYPAAPPVYQSFLVRDAPAFVQLGRGSQASHVVGVRSDGTLWAWGANNSTQVGDGTAVQRAAPVQIGSATNWQSAAVGLIHSLAIRTDGTLWAWGGNNNGQLGDGTITNRGQPIQIGSATNWQSVSTGASFSVGVRSDGTLWAWGINGNGQLGQGDTTQRTSPTQVGIDTNWHSAAAGGSYVIARRTDGTLWAWGLNSSGQLGFGDGLQRTSPAQVGTATDWQSLAAGTTTSYAVRTGGALWAWGLNSNGQVGDGTVTQRTSPVPIAVGSTWSEVIAGNLFAAARRSDGTLWTWGTNPNGQLGDATSTQRNVPAQIGTRSNWQLCTAGSTHLVAGTSDGQLHGWGSGESGQVVGISRPIALAAAFGNRTLVDAAAGDNCTVAVANDGTLWSVGLNLVGQLGDGTTVSRFTPAQAGVATNWQSVVAGVNHLLGLRSDGSLWAWGNNNTGQLGDASIIQRSTPVPIAAGSTWLRVAAGANFSAGVKSDGTLWTWGLNGNGQLGLGDTTQRTSPTQVGTATNWVAVAGGATFTLGLRADGTLWAWGVNSNGQLGLGDTTQRTSPVQVGTDTNWQAIATGGSFSLARRTDGTLWAWGANTNGQLGDNSTTQRNSPVQVGTDTDWTAPVAGISHSLALKTDGTLWTWGLNTTGQLADGAIGQRQTPQRVNDAVGWTLVRSGSSARHTMALRSGRMWGFGSNSSGQVPGGDIGRNTPRASVPARVPQAVTIDPFTAEVGVPVSITATADSGLPVSFAVTGPATLAGNQLTVTGSGEVRLDAWQVGDDTAWQPAGLITLLVSPDISIEYPAGTVLVDGVGSVDLGGATPTQPISRTFTVRNLGRIALTDFAFLLTGPDAVDFGLDATGMLASLPPGASTTFQVTFNPNVVGPHTALLRVASNAPGAKSTFEIALTATGVPNTITFTELESRATTALPFALVATASGGLPVSFQIVSAPGVANLAGNMVTLTGQPGAVTILATQAGGGVLAAAEPVYQSFVVRAGQPYIHLAPGASGAHSAALRADGTLWTWGNGVNGQTGNSLSGVTRQLGTDTWVSIAVGAVHTVAVRADHTLWAWGNSGNGQIGDGTTIQRNTPTQIGTDTNWRSAAAGGNHSLAVKQDGTLWAWGSNGSGQLGDGTTTQRNAPVQIGTATDWERVFSGGASSFALKANGTLWGWGQNNNGQVGDGSGLPRLSPVQIGTASNWQSIAAANTHTLGLRTDGTLWGWGINATGQLGDGVVGSRLNPAQIGTGTNWLAVAAGSLSNSTVAGHSVAVQGDGSLWAWGFNGTGQLGDGSLVTRTTPTRIGTRTGWQAVAARNEHIFAIDAGGSIWGSGNGESGTLASLSQPHELHAPFGNATVVSHAVGADHSAVVLSDGTLWTSGLNGNGQLGDGSLISQPSQTRLGTETNWRAVSAGDAFTIALKADGTLWAWGINGNGQLGQGNTTQRLTPTQVGTATNWAAVAANVNRVLALRTDGTLWGWGDNSNGALGLGDGTQRLSPAQAGTDTDWASLSTGGSHSLALKTDGTLWVWGTNTSGPLGLGDFTHRVSPTLHSSATWLSAVAGNGFTAAVRSDGTLWFFGQSNTSPVTTQIGSERDWQSVGAGASHALATKADGTLWGFRGNTNGGLALGPVDTTAYSLPVPISLASGWSLPRSGSGANHSLVLRSGRLWGFGLNSHGAIPSGDVGRLRPRLSDPTRVAQSIQLPAFVPVPGTPVALGFTSTSGLPVTPVLRGAATLVGDALTVTGAGEVTLDLVQRGDETAWQPAPVLRVIVTPQLHVALSDGTTLVDARSVVDLGTGTPGEEGPSQIVTVTNLGRMPLSGFGFTLLGAHASDFQIDATGLAGSLAFGESTSFRVHFAPGALGARSATLRLANNTPGSANPFEIQLTGTGVGSFIDFPEIAPRRPTDGAFALAATASNGLPVSYEIVSGGSLASLSGNIVTLTGGTGAVTIRATQAGGGFGPAAPVHQSFLVQNLPAFVKLGRGPTGSTGAGIRADGTLWFWGANSFWNFGLGDPANVRNVITQVPDPGPWQAVALTTAATVALRSDGTLWATGLNTSGQLGLGDLDQRTSFTQIGTDTNWTAVAGGSTHFLALKSDGTLWAWGSNGSGQLGLGHLVTQLSPVQVGTATNWQTIEAGHNHSLALKTDGSLWAWGSNTSAQLGLGDLSNRSTPERVGSATDWRALSGGSSHTLALRADGTLWAWGASSNGQVGTGPVDFVREPVQVGSATNWHTISAANNYSYGRRTDGTLWSWGQNITANLGQGDYVNRFEPTRVGTASDWETVVVGSGHVLGLRSDGSLWAWASGDVFQGLNLSRPVSLEAALGGRTVVSAAVGGDFAVAVATDGTLWGWGANTTGQLGDGTGLPQVAPIQAGTNATWRAVFAGLQSTYALRTDGTLWGWGANASGQLGQGDLAARYTPIQIGVATWQTVAAGSSFVLALRTDGTLWSCGINTNGQLGLGDAVNRNVPVQVGTDTNWQSVTAGFTTSGALKTDGTLWLWGGNTSGQLGQGDLTDRNVPAQVGTGTDWHALVVGVNHVVASKTDGTLWAWGGNFAGQLADGTSIDRLVPAQFGTLGGWTLQSAYSQSRTSAATRDGRLWIWGSNQNGQAPGGDVGRLRPGPALPARLPQGFTVPAFAASLNVPVALAATAASGLPVQYAVSGPATVVGNILTVTGPGQVTLELWQAGDRTAWEPAHLLSFVLRPEIALEQPAGTDLVSGSAAVAFGSAAVAAPADRTFTVRNPGQRELTDLGITFGGTNAADFSVFAAPSAPLAGGGAMTTFTVRFAPAAAGPRSATLQVASNDADEPVFEVALSGTGVVAPTNLTYAVTTATYTRGTAISPNVPAHSGGAVDSYSVLPALPAGLGLDPLTGVVSGTPTSGAPTTVFTVTATNLAGSSTAQLTLTVNEPPPTELTYAANPAVYRTGQTIAPNGPTNGGSFNMYFVFPNLPSGLAMNFSTGVITGAPTVASNATACLILANGPSGFATAALSIAVHQPPVFTSPPAALFNRGQPGTYQVTASGTPAPVFYVLGALPAGLTFSSSGLLSGTPGPNTGGINSITLVASNQVAPDATQVLALTINLPPLARDDVITAIKNVASTLPASAILANDIEFDGDPIAIVSVSPTSNQGGTVVFASGTITYTPPLDYLGADGFSYTVSDGRGGLGTALVFVTVAEDTEGRPVKFISLRVVPVGPSIRWQGLPGNIYQVEYAEAIDGAWLPLPGTITADGGGNIDYVDPGATNVARRFYRALEVP